MTDDEIREAQRYADPIPALNPLTCDCSLSESELAIRRQAEGLGYSFRTHAKKTAELPPNITAAMDQAFAALLDVSRMTARAYVTMIEEGVPSNVATQLVSEIIRGMRPQA